MMADSPVTSKHHKTLTKSDSMRFYFAPRSGAMGFAYGFTFASALCMLFLLLNPSSAYSFSPWFTNAFHSSSSSYRYRLSPVFAHIFNNTSSVSSSQHDDDVDHRLESNSSSSSSQISRKEGSGFIPMHTQNGLNLNQTSTRIMGSQNGLQREESLVGLKEECDMFEGTWIRDDSYPLYRSGSCPHIDEPFNCFLNGRLDNTFEKFRWQPKNCNIPRLNGNNMLEILRGKRLAFVGDSLNRNMWESLVCILRNSVEDKSKVFEVSGREEFRTQGSYSFIFSDYNCSVEFIRSPFLVQEWEMPDSKGSKKETLRLDLVEGSCDKYRSADVLIFNTGHWWTHEKRTTGKDYYQEGNHVHDQLNVEDAFLKALNTWSQWVDANIDPMKTLVFFRGYSPSHFMGGEWNSDGKCDNETEAMKNETNLSENPPMMKIIESVIKRMKTPVIYLNITKMADLRQDAHPSLYRKMNMTEEEKRSMLTHQDCSHWCLPGVPDLWNELVYAHLLLSMNRNKGNPQSHVFQGKIHGKNTSA